jgi:hypothetical protein
MVEDLLAGHRVPPATVASVAGTGSGS